MLNIGEGITYAMVWEPKVEGRRVVCNVTTAKKLKAPGADGKDYENSSWRNAVFIGKAYEKATKLENQSKIQIINGTVDNRPYTSADGTTKYFNNLVVFDFDFVVPKEKIEEEAQHRASKQNGTTAFGGVEDDSNVPY